jgi:micrococcal nuclease
VVSRRRGRHVLCANAFRRAGERGSRRGDGHGAARRRRRHRIRLLGIDTPETKKPGYSVGCWGPEASQFAASTLTGSRVGVFTDPTQDLHDRYGRTLAYLRKGDGWDYSVEAARAGAAKSYVYHGRPAGEYDAIENAQREAQSAQRGLWGPPCFGNTASVPD